MSNGLTRRYHFFSCSNGPKTRNRHSYDTCIIVQRFCVICLSVDFLAEVYFICILDDLFNGPGRFGGENIDLFQGQTRLKMIYMEFLNFHVL